MQIYRNFDLQRLNTFGLHCIAENFLDCQSSDDLYEAIWLAGHKPSLILGGGSNVLLTQDIPGHVIHVSNRGMQVLEENASHVILEVAAGESWDDFVQHAVRNNWGGVENLSLIPGTVGAAPMQNIGAYGVELKSVFVSLDALHLPTGEMHVFSPADCEFGYRTSTFKTQHKNQYLIVRVRFRLSKMPMLHLDYGSIREELEKMQVHVPGIADVSQAVIRIRKSKLPDPELIGNAGSFFKNPVVTPDQFEQITAIFPDVVSYPQGDSVKLAAGWLIEKAGWKGYREGAAGVHEKQALVLVNYGGAAGSEVYGLSEKILQDVSNKFGVELEREVNIV